jgi:hypothetical protein
VLSVAVLQVQFLHTRGGSTAFVSCIGYRLRANHKEASTRCYCELPEIACVVSFPHSNTTTVYWQGRHLRLSLKVSTLTSATRVRTHGTDVSSRNVQGFCT